MPTPKHGAAGGQAGTSGGQHFTIGPMCGGAPTGEMFGK
ncbi:hypothetical protein DOT_4930 [Desulfosporosinus sp. OT]|nr:hypothetical protein DOT_4930 [Desulfosporosinus sp. OT]